MHAALEAAYEELQAARRRLLDEPRPGPVAVVVVVEPGRVVVALPLQPADADGAPGDRGRRAAAAAAGALAVAGGLPPPTTGAGVELEAATWRGLLCVALEAEEPALVGELAELALDEASRALDRVRLAPRALAAELPTLPLDRPDWLWTAEVVARLGGAAGATRTDDDVRAALDGLAASRPPPPPPGVGSPHTDPQPARRVLRRILHRLDGMGKYGGFHTEFRHLARGFAGDERALALAAGEALLRAGLLAEKPSVGQRHVSLVASRTAEIRRLVDEGHTDDPVLRTFLRPDPARRPSTGAPP